MGAVDDPGARETRRWRNLIGLVSRPRPVVGATPADAVHHENKWRLLRYRARPEGLAYETPVVLVPSLINRHYVLDLQPGRSFVEFLVARGHDVFIVDWGTPGDEDRYLSFDAICEGYIGRALRVAAQHSRRNKAHLLGYCLGGTLAAIYTAAHPERVASLTGLAAPVAFHDGGMLTQWTNTPTFDLDALCSATGLVPWQVMQGAFQMLRPTLPLSKAAHLLDRAWDDEFLDGYLALETWGNDNVSFPGEAYRRYIDALYRGDDLVAGRFTLGGRRCRLEAITCPTLAVSFAHDNIVSQTSVAQLIEKIASPDKTLLTLSGGHVGAVVSRKASEGLWPRLAAWWAAHDHDAPAPAVTSPAPAVTSPAPAVTAPAPATLPKAARRRKPAR
ncbi:MAG: alpha/beta fold hydrolase [Myxococcales bacterium]|nr:alpha/beta fold hydrolase [Myxococcales bacterium]